MTRHETLFVTRAELILVEALVTGPRMAVTARFVTTGLRAADDASEDPPTRLSSLRCMSSLWSEVDARDTGAFVVSVASAVA